MKKKLLLFICLLSFNSVLLNSNVLVLDDAAYSMGLYQEVRTYNSYKVMVYLLIEWIERSIG